MTERISYLHNLPLNISKESYRSWAELHDFEKYLISLETCWAQLEFDSEEIFEYYSKEWKLFKQFS